MNWLKIGALSLLAVLLVATGSSAEEKTTPVAWGALSPTFGPSGLGLPKGFLAVGGNLVYGQSNGLRKHDERLNGKVKSTKLTEVFKLRYGIMNGLDIRAAIPVYNVYLEKTPAADRHVYGIGDTTLLLHKTLLSQKKGDPLSFAVDFGAILPTGSVSEHSSDLAGNSTWGLMGGLGATYFTGANRFDIETNYAVFAEGAHDYEKGNRYRLNLAYAYALTDNWDLGAESTLEIADESSYNGEGNDDSYLEWYIGPKVTFKYKPWKTNVGIIAQAPVNRWYQGVKGASDDYRLSLKVMKAFNFNALFD